MSCFKYNNIFLTYWKTFYFTIVFIFDPVICFKRYYFMHISLITHYTFIFFLYLFDIIKIVYFSILYHLYFNKLTMRWWFVFYPLYTHYIQYWLFDISATNTCNRFRLCGGLKKNPFTLTFYWNFQIFFYVLSLLWSGVPRLC